MKFKLANTLLFFFGVFLVLTGCEGSDYRQSAQGDRSEVLVVMDSTRWDSETADAIRETFGEYIMTLPRPEERFDLRFTDINTQRELDRAQRHRSVIFAAPLDEDSNVGGFIRSSLSDDILERVERGDNFAFPLDDRWYRDQWTLFLTSNNDEELAQNIREDGSDLVSTLHEKTIQRWKNYVYRSGEQVDKADSLWENHGFRFRVQHDYRIGVDTTNFVTMRRHLHDNDRWLWAWYKEDVEDTDIVDSDWIHEIRDSLNREFVQGSREGSYVTTEFRRPVETESINLNGYPAYETRGTWQMTNDLMGGPFLNYTIFDEVNDRVYMLEFAQFAPRYNKRRFVYQFEAIARTFESDSTLTERAEELSLRYLEQE